MHPATHAIVTLILAAAAQPAAAQTQNTPPVPSEAADVAQAPPASEEPGSPRLSVDLSVRYTSDYFFRGIVQKTDSFNLQPAVEVGFELIRNEGFSLSLLGGSWSNFSDDRPQGASGDFGEYWYEHDTYIGVSADIDRLSVAAVYTWYASPSSDFLEYEDLTFSVSYNDSGDWDDDGKFAINPSVSVALETKNAALGPDSGAWLGLGIEPTIDLGATPLGPTTLSFPVAVGLSLDNYYQRADGSSDTFGYAEVGAKLSFDLADSLGPAAPAVDVGASYLFLDGALDEINGGNSGDLVFAVGLSWSF